MTRLRKNGLFPKQLSDVGAFTFVVCMIPTTYIYEVHVVLPALYNTSPISYIIHMVIGAFLLLNLVGNFLGLWLTDTSTRYVVLPSSIHVSKKYCLVRLLRVRFLPFLFQNNKWKLCAACEAVTPPRAWHCTVCNVCVLKREHHCMFVGYCVGHKNHRFSNGIIPELFRTPKSDKSICHIDTFASSCCTCGFL